jgi:spore maturation protein CgeB
LKFTILGLTISSSWGNGHATPLRAIIRGLHRLGHEVTFFERETTYYAQHRDLGNPDFCKLHFYDDWLNIRRAVLNSARESDVIMTTSFLPDGAAILDELLPLERPLRVYYDLDTPITLGRLQAGVEAEYLAAHQVREFDVVLSFTGGRALGVLREDFGARHVAPIYGCVDPDVHRRTAATDFYTNDFSYLGTYAQDRQAKLETLFFEAARRVPAKKFMVVGSMFPAGMDWPVNAWYKPHVAPSQHSAFYSSSRATLNITRAEMAALGHCPSPRIFEAAACGTPIISDDFEGIGEFLQPDEEITIAHSTDDAVNALQRPDAELARQAVRARERVLDEHTGDVRARQMLAEIEAAGSRSFAEVA